MAVITRIFPADRRGQAMALWGATAGVATLVGPILGGILVNALGWQWIFFINIPVGVLGFFLAVRLVPVLPSPDLEWMTALLADARIPAVLVADVLTPSQVTATVAKLLARDLFGVEKVLPSAIRPRRRLGTRARQQGRGRGRPQPGSTRSWHTWR